MHDRVAAVTLAIALALVSPLAARAAVPAGGIYLTTLPAGADVWVDGTYVGRSPVFVDALAGGPHSVTITKSGWSVREIEVDVAAGRTALASVELTAVARPATRVPSGNVILRGVPAGAKVAVDGLALREPSQPLDLVPGEHRVTVESATAKTTRTFNVLPETTTQVVVQRLPVDVARSAVVAPIDDYLPKSAYSIEGKKIVVRYGGHVVVAHLGDSAIRYDGATLAYDGAPATIGSKLYLPLELLERLTTKAAK